MRTRNDEASSAVMLVTSISARRLSPNADCTAMRPRPSAQLPEVATARAATATARKANAARGAR